MDNQYLLQKINNGDNSFTDEEFYYISKNVELKTALILVISNKTMNLNSSIIDFVEEQIMNSLRDLHLSHNIVSNFWLNFFTYSVDIGFYSQEIINFMMSLNLNEEDYSIMFDYVDKAFDDKENDFKELHPDKKIINQLLDHKRYDVIESLDPVYSKNCIDEDIYNRIIKEWPYDTKAKIIIRYEKEKSIINYSIDDSFSDLIYCFYNDLNNKWSILDVILEKIENISISDDISELNYLNEVKNVLLECNVDIVEYAKILYDKNIIHYSDILLENGIITSDDFNNKVKYCFNNNLPIPVVYFNEDFERSDAFINYLINNGRINILLKNCLLLKQYGVDLSQYSFFCYC